MTKKMKIFKTGEYPQGKFFDIDKLINGIKNIPGILYHTSHHLKNGMLEKDIPILAEFKNITADNDGNVYADCDLNDKGKEYFENDKIKNLSVEIDKNGKLCKVGLLPPGIKPQIAGLSQFEDEIYTIIEFETTWGEEVMTIEELIKNLMTMSAEDREKALMAILQTADLNTKINTIKAVKNSITADERAAARVVAYEFSEAVKEPVKAKTEDEIRAEITKEFEAKQAIEKAEAEKKTAVAEFEELLKKKVVPAHHEAYKMAFEATYSDNAEFAEKREDIKKKVAEMPESVLLSEFAKKDGKDKKDNEDDGFQKGVEIVKTIKGGI